MIDHDKQAIFLHIGKTAGSSIEQLLHAKPLNAMVANRNVMFGWDEEEKIYLQHASAATTRHLVGEEIFDQYFKFTIVRNPYSRLLSVYHYTIKQHQAQYGDFRGFIRAVPKLLESETAQKGSHCLPQTAYTHIDGEKVCSYIGKFETLPLSMEPVRARLNIQTPLTRVNTHRAINWSKRSVASYYDPDTITIMQDLYAGDFELFEYSTDPKDIPYSFWNTQMNNVKTVLRPYIPQKLRAFVRRI